MNKLNAIGLALCIGGASLPAGADVFDGSQPLLCASIDIMECAAGAECGWVTAEDINVPQFLRIDFKEKKITAAQETSAKRSAEIEHMESVDGKLIMQGVQDGVEGVRDGVGWSLAIGEASGKMVLSASGDEVAFVVFGACTPL